MDLNLHSCPGICVGNAVRSRLFREAVVWIARAGTSWHQLPAMYGKWNSVYRRYAAWCDRGIWARLMLSVQDDPDLSAVRLDSTIVCACAHVSAVGAPPKKRRIPRWVAVGAVSARKSIGYRIDGAIPCACA